MDENENIIPTGRKTYFMSEIDIFETVAQVNQYAFWDGVEDQLAKNPIPGDEVIVKLEKLHILDENWEFDEYEDATEFWQWASKLMKKVGPFVKELHIELAKEAEDFNTRMKIRALKVKFLTSMSEWFPNLKALKLSGEGFKYEDLTLRREFLEIVKGTKILNVEYLDVGGKISASHMVGLIQKQFLCGTTLTEVKATVYQLFSRIHRCILPSVKTIHLADYGADSSSNTDEFVKFFVKHLPNVRNLYFVDTCMNLVINLPKFLMGVQNQMPLDTFGIDQSANWFSNDSDVKITGIPSVWIDLRDSPNTSLQVLGQIGDVPEIFLDNWDLSRMSPIASPEDVKNGIKAAIKINMPLLQKVSLYSSDGLIEEFQL